MKVYHIYFLFIISFFVLSECNTQRSDTYSDKKEEGNLMIINDFENLSDLRNLEGQVSLSEEFPAHGSSCLKLTDSVSKSLWFETKEIPKVWSPYEYLKFDIYNPSSRLYYGTLQIFDQQGTDEQAEFNGQSYFGEGKLFLNTGWNHFKFLVQTAMIEEGNRLLDLDKIRKIRWSFGVTDNPVYIDNIRLVKGNESAADRSLVRPEDCTVIIDNRNVFQSLSGPVDKIRVNPVILELRKEAIAATDALRNEIRIAEMQGYQSFYQKIPLITADVGMGIRKNLVWFQNETEEKKILEYVIASCTKASEELTEILSARQSNVLTMEPENEVSNASFYVPPYPPMSELKAADGIYRDKSGNPVIIFSMLQLDDGPLMDYFAPFNHRLESYTVGGGSRYNIETSPVYEAFHKYTGTHRVGWDGWCGHLIKDRWSMGGKKEDVVICLESTQIRDAVRQYIKLHHSEWSDNPNLLYNIMAYELQYICYCEKSQQMFRGWLKLRYSDIKALNNMWMTNYKSFAEIMAPETRNARPVDNINRAAWYDWAEFNTRRFTDYLIWIKTEMRKFDHKTPICAGGTSSMLASSNSVTGIDEELIINEVDDVILNESGGSPIFSDLLLSMSNRKKVMVDPEMGGSTHGLLLQFLHGKSDISKWWWAAMPSKEYPHMNESSLPHSKEISLSDIAEVLKIGLDVRRLSSEITEFTRNDPEVAILYSKSSIIQVPPQQVQSGSTPYIDALESVWEGARFLGCRIGFVTENQIMHDHLSTLKLLIVPAVKYIQPEIVSEIKNYIEKGGLAVIIPESFIFDEHARENDLINSLGITIREVTLPPEIGKGEKVQNYDQSFSQATLYGEVRKRINCEHEDLFAGKTDPVSLMSEGLVQTIDPGSNKVLARFDDGRAAIVLVKAGRGAIYYLAAPLKTSDYHLFLSQLAGMTGLSRPVIGIGKDGNLITGAEVRAVERKNDYLVYASNLTSAMVEFDFKASGVTGSILDLRKMTESNSTHIKLEPYQESIFRIEKLK
jgi:hypothetical protein